MMALRASRRLATGALIGCVALSGCSIATKQARTSAIINATDHALGQHLVGGTVSVDVVPIPPRRPISGAGLIQPASAKSVPFVVDPGSQRAALLGADGKPLMLFTAKLLYESRGDPSAMSNLSGFGGSLDNPTNVVALTVGGPATQKTGPGLQSTTLSASAQAAMAVQARSSQSAGLGNRPWLELDYSSIPLNQRGGRVAGSYAVSPWLVLELARGVLTGSVEPTGGGQPAAAPTAPATTVYKVNFGLEKATKHLSSSEQQVVARIMAANAISGTVFPGYVWLTPDHRLGGLVIEFRQSLSSDEQAVLAVTVVLSNQPPAGQAPAGPLPDLPNQSQVVSVSSLGSLVHAVAGR